MFLRSDINLSITQAISFFNKQNIPLPPYAFFSPQAWQAVGPEYAEVKACHLGWDVTDFGTGDFAHYGRTIFTLRNGLSKSTKYHKPYSQKVMHLVEGKKSAIHHHRSKHEDIVNHAGGQIAIKVWGSTKSGQLSSKTISLSISGIHCQSKAGQTHYLKPGDSIYLPPHTYHQFWARLGQGDVASMEVSSVNDDYTDNVWFAGGTRFPAITDNEPAQYVLCSEY